RREFGYANRVGEVSRLSGGLWRGGEMNSIPAAIGSILPRAAARRMRRLALLSSTMFAGSALVSPLYSACLGNSCNVTDEASLIVAINYANANAGTTISIQSGTITLTAALPALQGTGTVISGTGTGTTTISGNNQFRGFFAYSGSTTIQNLGIANTSAIGG